MRQLAPLLRSPKLHVRRIFIFDHLGPALALQPRKRFRKDKGTVLITDGTLVPTCAHTIAEQSKNYRHSTNNQAVHRRHHPAGRRDRTGPARKRNGRKAREEFGAKVTVGRTMPIADGGHPGTGFVMSHRRRKDEALPDWNRAHTKSHKQVRARVEHVFARMTTWKVLRDCRLKGGGVHHALRLDLARQTSGRVGHRPRPHRAEDHLRGDF